MHKQVSQRKFCTQAPAGYIGQATGVQGFGSSLPIWTKTTVGTKGEDKRVRAKGFNIVQTSGSRWFLASCRVRQRRGPPASAWIRQLEVTRKWHLEAQGPVGERIRASVGTPGGKEDCKQQ
mmetsp:Transcript_84417/g.176699  ORF Transcript_84417/g.176699 Transcript_84417/m.176699 type:complete len:121 (+) Transcript_84417:185-547(+)